MKNYLLSITSIVFLLSSCSNKQGEKPQHKDIIDAVFASGKAITINQYKITAYTEGYLTASLVSEGDSVSTGQALFRIQNDVQQTQVSNAADNLKFAEQKVSATAPQLLQLQEQINEALLKKHTDSVNFIRYQKLIKTNAVAKVDYDNVSLTYNNTLSSIKVLEKQLADLKQTLTNNVTNARAQYEIQQQNNGFYTLKSGTNGLILNVFKKNGDLVKKGETVADMGSGKIIAKLFVAEDDIQRVVLKQPVFISLNTDKSKTYKATISKIYPSFDGTSQSFLVEASFIDKPAVLKEGTQLQANIVVAEKKNVMVIPAQYLLEGDSVVLVGTHQRKAINCGIKTLEWAEVTGGLRDNEELELPKNNH